MKLLENLPAILIEKPEPTIVVSDIHFGFEEELRERGIRVPSQTWKITECLIKMIEMWNPRRLIVLGDLKHKIPHSSLIEWEEMPKAIEEIRKKGVEIILVPGNHDGNIKKILGDSVTYAPSHGLLIECGRKLFLYHGHRWPSADVVKSDIVLMGHLHPMINFRTEVGGIVKKPVWLLLEGDKRSLVKVFREKYGLKVRGSGRIDLIVLPAFNPILSGISINNLKPRDRLWPLVRAGSFTLSKAEMILLSGHRLGRVEQVEKVAEDSL